MSFDLSVDESSTPKEVLETAALAEELHAKLYPQESESTEVIDPTEVTPTDDPAPDVEQPAETESDDVDYKSQALLYKSRLEQLSSQYREQKQTLEQMKAVAAPPETKKDTSAQIDEVLAKLREEYPEELIENIMLLNRLQSEQIVSERVKPVQDTATSVQDIQEQIAQQNYMNSLTAKAPNWSKVWETLQELEQGQDPSDPKLANFLLSPDPSGLYTNMQLLDMYNNKWDVDKFAKICNMYSQAKAPAPNNNRDALMAPARTNSQPAPSTSNDYKIWTMGEFQQFQKDERAGKYEGREAEAEALWTDAQLALSQGRFR